MHDFKKQSAFPFYMQIDDRSAGRMKIENRNVGRMYLDRRPTVAKYAYQ